MRSFHPVILTLLASCTWVSDDEVDARRAEMDDDLDGYPVSEDCNDRDPEISPAAEEVWYNGIDDNCDGQDDFDADGDGYVLDEYVGYTTNGIEGSGALAGGDCNESDASIHPNAEDPWYDGIDSDCVGNDDFDQDGDGYQASEYNADADASGGDCDDINDQVGPFAEDIWYDGIDTDCGGEDDFDADQDGHATRDIPYSQTLYVESSSVLSAEDCNDQNSAVHPEADDPWYDGSDSDCSGNDDFDSDSDGYVQDEDIGKVTDGICISIDPGTSEETITEMSCLSALTCEDGSGLEWSCSGISGSGALAGGDCDDTNPEANPAEVEILSDLIDHDCDGGSDTLTLSDIADSTMNLESFDWTQPYRPRFASNSSQLFLSVVLEEGSSLMTSGVVTDYYDSAIAFALDINDLQGGVVEMMPWQRAHSDSSVYYLSGGHGFIATDDALYGATSLQWYDSSNRGVVLYRYDLATSSRVPMLYQQATNSPGDGAEIEDLNIALDGNESLHVLACESEDGVGMYMNGTLEGLETGDIETEIEIPDLALSTCDLHFDSDPLGLVVGAQSSVDGQCYADGVATGQSCTAISECEDGSGVIWACNGGINEGLASYGFNRLLTLPSFNLQSNNGIFYPEHLVIADGETGSRVVFTDPDLGAVGIQDPDGTIWVEDLGGQFATSLHATPDETAGTDQVVISLVTNGGEIWILWGTAASGLDSIILSPDFTPLDAAAWFDPSGEMLIVAASSEDSVRLGMAYR